MGGGGQARWSGQGQRPPATSTTQRAGPWGLEGPFPQSPESRQRRPRASRLSPGGEIVGEEDSGRLLGVKGTPFPRPVGTSLWCEGLGHARQAQLRRDLTRGWSTASTDSGASTQRPGRPGTLSLRHGQRCAHPETGTARDPLPQTRGRSVRDAGCTGFN